MIGSVWPQIGWGVIIDRRLIAEDEPLIRSRRHGFAAPRPTLGSGLSPGEAARRAGPRSSYRYQPGSPGPQKWCFTAPSCLAAHCRFPAAALKRVAGGRCCVIGVAEP